MRERRRLVGDHDHGRPEVAHHGDGLHDRRPASHRVLGDHDPIAFRQRAIETVAPTADGLEFRLVPVPGRPIPELGFGCDGNPNLLRVTRRGPHEISLPGCSEFPSNLQRCKTV